MKNSSDIDDITFVLRKKLEIYRVLECFNDFNFYPIGFGNKLQCHYNGACFNLKFLFRGDKISIFFSYPTYKDYTRIAFDFKSTFTIGFNEISILPNKITAELKKRLITNIFKNDDEVFSFVKSEINSRIIFKFSRQNIVYDKMSDFIKKELNITSFELENLYLSRSNENIKSKVNLGEYRISLKPNNSQENIVFTHKVSDNITVTAYLYKRSN